MIALMPRDDVPALAFAFLDKILAGHLQRRLDRLRSAAHEIDMVEARGRILDQAIRQPLGDLGREEAGMGIGDGIELAVKRRENIRVAVTETGHRRAAGCIEVAFAIAVEQFDAFAADGDRHHGIGGAVKNMGHDGFLPPLGLRWVFNAARCWSVCRSVASASSPPRPAMTAPRTSATAKAGDMA